MLIVDGFCTSIKERERVTIFLHFCTFPVAPSGVTISQQPTGSVNHGSNITFTGSYAPNLLNIIIKWQKKNGSSFMDIDVTGNDKYSGSSVTGSSPKLVINPVQFIDETSYRLMVINGVGFSKSIPDAVLDVTGGTCIYVILI